MAQERVTERVITLGMVADTSNLRVSDVGVEMGLRLFLQRTQVQC